jgi:hypothetical protein
MVTSTINQSSWYHQSVEKTTIRTTRWVPGFKGKHNSVRSKVLLILLDNRLSGGNGLTLRELTSLSGANYASLAVLLRKWSTYTRRKPIGYSTVTRGGIPVKVYRILRPGQKWLDRWIHEGYLPIERYLAELDEVRRNEP